MIIKGAARCNGGQLGSYLGNYLHAEKNDRVEMIELRGSAFTGLDQSLRSWEAEATGRCRNALWHAQLRTPDGEALTREMQIKAVDVLEQHLGLVNQPRTIVIHENDGHEHIHVVWSRIRRHDETVTLKNGKTKTYKAGSAIRDDFSHKKNVAAAREIEKLFDLQRVECPEFKKSGDRRQNREESKKAFTYGDYKKAKRSGLDPKERVDLCLATRFADLDPASIPQASHVMTERYRAFREANPDTGEPEKQRAAQKPRPAGVTVEQDKHEDKPKSLRPEDIIADITRSHSTFTKGDLDYEIRKRLELHTADDLTAIDPRYKHDSATAQAVTKAVMAHDDFIELGPDRVERTRFTGRDILTTELALRDASDVLAARNTNGVWQKRLDDIAKYATLNEQQKGLVQHVTSPGDFKAGIGLAGTGKSYTMGVAREAWEASGKRVYGLALAGMAAQSLQEGSGIESQTIARLFARMEKLPEQEKRLAAMDARIKAMTATDFSSRKRKFELQAQRDQFAHRLDGARFTSRDVIVLDEAGMVGSRQMNQLLQAVQKAGAKLVMIGDAEQLQAIDAGGAFRALTDRHGAFKLTQNQRHEQDWHKQATEMFGEGFTGDALKEFKDRGHIKEFATAEDARTRIIADWTASRDANPNEKHLLMAYTKVDVAALNREAREIYKAEGRVGAGEEVKTETGRKEFGRGDRLYFLSPDSRVGVMNGSLGTVDQIQRDSLNDNHSIRVKLDTGKTVEFNTNEYSKFDHGYAAIVHKSQGATASRTHILASQYMDRHATYVGLSRQVKQADMYYSKEEFGNYAGLVRNLSRDGRKDTTLDYLHRAEKAGTPETFWDRVNKTVVKVVEIVTKDEERKRAAERLIEALKIRNDPAAKAERDAERKAQREAATQAAKLREILGDQPDHRVHEHRRGRGR